MATYHAGPGELVDLGTWGADIPVEHSKTIGRLRHMELARIVLKAGESWSSHEVAGPIVLQCLSGRVEYHATGGTNMLCPGQLVYLEGGDRHGLTAREDTAMLVTFVFP